jgi:hypothetical protein
MFIHTKFLNFQTNVQKLQYTAILLDLHNHNPVTNKYISLNILLCNYTECLKQVRGGSATNSKVKLTFRYDPY